ncbi:ParB family chromosome partitioning protein [Actimicrobium sp. GrIS 1.19]|uniref:ParB/RepB/Spo0J family partition protein n=1 Tax=Actimicrobium sp. GrIS 1.19 TaxID=3071708 RepID=UPI002E097852|nr:ParB family chromosome partitioning protein [Actimicrobium sp. GrIS 1.19]
MSAKPDRKALLRKSITSESTALEQRFPTPADVDKRFADAEQVLAGRTQGLMGPATTVKADPEPARVAGFSAETAGARRILRVPIERTHDNPMNARSIYDPDVIKAMAASLATRGQLVPAAAIAHPTIAGDVILLDGQYRKRGLLAAGKSEIDVALQEVTSNLEMYRISFLMNEERNGQTTLDNALGWDKLLREGVVAEADGIAELTGISKSNVAKTLALLKLPAAAIDKIQEKPAKFGIAVGYELVQCAKVLNEQALLALMDRVVAEDISSRALESLRHKLTSDSPRKKKEVSRQYKIYTAGQQVGFIKEWDSGKVTLEVNLPDQIDREALVASLKRRFTVDESVDSPT